ncbi:MAG: hypothetical protein LBS63_01720 [Prevotellaceae bacterium]|jgi:predicted nucleic acid-binding protein|nr:hypothetical protein [Prevotellaceae bacterium]
MLPFFVEGLVGRKKVVSLQGGNKNKTMYRVYLDNCCFNRPYDDQTQPKISFETQAKLFVQGLVLQNEVELVWSYILKFENSRNIFGAKRASIAQWEALSSQFVEASADTTALAKEIVQTGIKEFDALHLACAIIAHCNFFITVDKKILKYNDKRIIVCNPIQFLHEHYYE